jgi:hypothetical protein
MMKFRNTCAPSGFGASTGMAIWSNHISAPSVGRVIGDLDAVVGLGRAVARLQHVTGPAEGHADIAIGQRVDVFRAVELLDVGADRPSAPASALAITSGRGCRGPRPDRPAPPGSSRSAHPGNARRIRPAFPCSPDRRSARASRSGRILAEDLGHLADVHADAGGAPHVVDRIGMPGSYWRCAPRSRPTCFRGWAAWTCPASGTHRPEIWRCRNVPVGTTTS